MRGGQEDREKRRGYTAGFEEGGRGQKQLLVNQRGKA